MMQSEADSVSVVVQPEWHRLSHGFSPGAMDGASSQGGIGGRSTQRRQDSVWWAKDWRARQAASDRRTCAYVRRRA